MAVDNKGLAGRWRLNCDQVVHAEPPASVVEAQLFGDGAVPEFFGEGFVVFGGQTLRIVTPELITARELVTSSGIRVTRVERDRLIGACEDVTVRPTT